MTLIASQSSAAEVLCLTQSRRNAVCFDFGTISGATYCHLSLERHRPAALLHCVNSLV